MVPGGQNGRGGTHSLQHPGSTGVGMPTPPAEPPTPAVVVAVVAPPQTVCSSHPGGQSLSGTHRSSHISPISHGEQTVSQWKPGPLSGSGGTCGSSEPPQPC